MTELQYIGRNQDTYPRRLLRMPDPPKGFYVLGSPPSDDLPSVAIVGSRMCSPYGRKTASLFAGELASQGVQVVSGMALGIDGHAHEGALEAGGRTFAVLGCGADICYPVKNQRLYRDIPAHGGILSEEEPGTPPLPYNFPKRNRIISALSDLVLVVEARKKSGSLITADSALEQGRTVMAIPGRVGDALAEGTNFLIAQGAEIAWSVQAVLDVLLPLHSRQKAQATGSIWAMRPKDSQLTLDLGAAKGSQTKKEPLPASLGKEEENREEGETGLTGQAGLAGEVAGLSGQAGLAGEVAGLSGQASLAGEVAGLTGLAGLAGLRGQTSRAHGAKGFLRLDDWQASMEKTASFSENAESRLVRLVESGVLAPLEARICQMLVTESLSFDELAEALEANASDLSSALLSLQLGGHIEETAGGRYGFKTKPDYGLLRGR